MNRRSFLTSLAAGVTTLLLGKLPKVDVAEPCYWKGEVAHVHIYDYALGPNELYTIMLSIDDPNAITHCTIGNDGYLYTNTEYNNDRRNWTKVGHVCSSDNRNPEWTIV